MTTMQEMIHLSNTFCPRLWKVSLNCRSIGKDQHFHLVIVRSMYAHISLQHTHLSEDCIWDTTLATCLISDNYKWIQSQLSWIHQIHCIACYSVYCISHWLQDAVRSIVLLQSNIHILAKGMIIIFFKKVGQLQIQTISIFPIMHVT